MIRVIAALALAAIASPAPAQSNSVDLHYEVTRTDKEELQGRGVGTALLKVRSSTGAALVVTAQCSFTVTSRSREIEMWIVANGNPYESATYATVQ